MYELTKRVMEYFLSLLLAILLLPIFLIISIAIFYDSKGKAIYTQWRVGKHHKLFKMYKFRTMKQNAEKESALLRDDSCIFLDNDSDPRLTKIGKFLRATSLDELPQLINVIKGEMALIGPRPFVLYESNKLPPIALRRLNVLPGITGYAQVEGRKKADVIDRVAHDIYYVEHMCLKNDIRILFATVGTVLKKSGAY